MTGRQNALHRVSVTTAAALMLSGAAVLAGAGPAAAADADHLFVSSGGSDAGPNNCQDVSSPCRTVQHAVDLAEPELNASHDVTITLTQGNYEQPAGGLSITATPSGSAPLLIIVGTGNTGAGGTFLTLNAAQSDFGVVATASDPAHPFNVALQQLAITPPNSTPLPASVVAGLKGRGGVGFALTDVRIQDLTSLGVDNAADDLRQTSLDGIDAGQVGPVTLTRSTITGLSAGRGGAGNGDFGGRSLVTGIEGSDVQLLAGSEISHLRAEGGGDGGDSGTGRGAGGGDAEVDGVVAHGELTLDHATVTDLTSGNGGAGGDSTDEGSVGGDGGGSVVFGLEGEDVTSIVDSTLTELAAGNPGNRGHGLAGDGGLEGGPSVTGFRNTSFESTTLTRSEVADLTWNGGGGSPRPAGSVGAIQGIETTGQLVMTSSTVTRLTAGDGVNDATATDVVGVDANGPDSSVTSSVIRVLRGGPGATVLRPGATVGERGGSAVGVKFSAPRGVLDRSEISDIRAGAGGTGPATTGAAGGAGGDAFGVEDLGAPGSTITDSTISDITSGAGGAGGAGGNGGNGGLAATVVLANLGPTALTHLTAVNVAAGGPGVAGSSGLAGTAGVAAGLLNFALGTVHGATVVAASLLNSPNALECATADASTQTMVPTVGYTDNGYNVSQDNSCSFTGPGNQVVADLGTGLQALGDHGGSLPAAALGGPSWTVGVDITTAPGRTVALAVTDAQYCSGEFSTDQRGEPVPGTGTSACAAGAYEPQGSLPPATGGGTPGNGGAGHGGAGRDDRDRPCGALTKRPAC